MIAKTVEDYIFELVREYYDCADFPDELFIEFAGYAEDENGEEDQSGVCHQFVIHRDSGNEGFIFKPIAESKFFDVMYPAADHASCFVWMDAEGNPDCMSEFETDLSDEHIEQTLMAIKRRYSMDEDDDLG